MKQVKEAEELEALEIRLLTEGIQRRYGFDFRNYALASLRRRIGDAVEKEKLPNISALQERVLHDPEGMARLLDCLTIHVTSMFRDPDFYRAFRQKSLPYLRTYPFIKIWVAGCSSGEEVYSMAILLKEEGLYDRCMIYATDISEPALRKAKAGIFPLRIMKEYTENYLRAGGRGSFSEYYTADSDNAVLSRALKENMVFAQHNLATDGSFNEFNAILCRNVMIYFNKELQNRAHSLLYGSLGMFGILGIGRRESLKFTPHESCYEDIDGREKLYRRTR